MKARLPTALVAALIAASGDPAGPAWDGRLIVHGALRAMFHDGAIGATVRLDTLLPDETLYAVGALEGLAGEITVVGGVASIAVADGSAVRVVSSVAPTEAATLLVAARVRDWVTVVGDRALTPESFDDDLVAIAASAGWSADDRFPFLIEGELDALAWHVIDGSRLDGGGGSHDDHLAAALRFVRTGSPATLIGFHSPSDRGVFTHADSRTHVHCVVENPSRSGHVDHVEIPAGARFSFPRRETTR